MANVTYKISPLSVTEKSAFTEASKEELRVLLALIELGGSVCSEDELARTCSISRARCISSLAFWEEAEVIRRAADEPTITEEFEERLTSGEIDEVDAKTVAKSIRDENLAEMISECASMLGVASLPSVDVKNLTALNTQYALSAEFILTLTAYLAGKGKLTVRKIVDNAIKLADSGCDTVEALEAHIDMKEKQSSVDWELRKILGIYDRNLSDTERKYFKKWSEDYNFGVPIISEAFDRTVLNTSKTSLPYMDKILAGWHKAGCKTLEECIAHTEQKIPEEATPKKSKTKPEPPRYGSFDISDAFKRALDRSYGGDAEDND